MHQLGAAINESLSESESIAEVIGEIKQEGYDVFLVLEATIGFNKRSEFEEPEFESESIEARVNSFSEQDEAFLKALKITVDD